MKSMRTAIVTIWMMQWTGLVAGVNNLPLVIIWLSSWVGTFIWELWLQAWYKTVEINLKEREL